MQPRHSHNFLTGPTPPISFFSCRFKDHVLEDEYEAWSNERLGVKSTSKVYPEQTKSLPTSTTTESYHENECSSRYIASGEDVTGLGRQRGASFSVGVGKKRWRLVNLLSCAQLVLIAACRSVFLYVLTVFNNDSGLYSWSKNASYSDTCDNECHRQAVAASMYAHSH